MEAFTLKTGRWQRSLLLPLLFNFIIVVPANAVIEIIKVRKEEVKLSLLAGQLDCIWEHKQ